MKPSSFVLTLLEKSTCIPWLMEMGNTLYHPLERQFAANRVYALCKEKTKDEYCNDCCYNRSLHCSYINFSTT